MEEELSMMWEKFSLGEAEQVGGFYGIFRDRSIGQTR
jgi:hypothetical protein